MMPIAPLMVEHRLIERMIKLIGTEAARMKNGGQLNVGFISIAVDFIKTYADRLHHGKEENILFRDLAKKKLLGEHKKIMDELIQEHAIGRSNVKKIVEALGRYTQGDKKAGKEIIDNMAVLVEFYPQHIMKEDKRFFLPVMSYFNDQEKEKMLNEFHAFDQKFIHIKYREIVIGLESTGGHIA